MEPRFYHNDNLMNTNIMTQNLLQLADANLNIIGEVSFMYLVQHFPYQLQCRHHHLSGKISASVPPLYLGLVMSGR